MILPDNLSGDKWNFPVRNLKLLDWFALNLRAGAGYIIQNLYFILSAMPSSSNLFMATITLRRVVNK